MSRSDPAPEEESRVDDQSAADETPDLTPIDRRKFLGTVAACSLGFTALAVGGTAIASMVPPSRSIDGKTKVGALALVKVTDLPIEKPVPFEYGDDTVFLVRMRGDKIVALSAACPHVACKLHWDEVKKQFACPCHASYFTLTGRKVSGPALRNMDPAIFTVQAGKVVVTGIQTG